MNLNKPKPFTPDKKQMAKDWRMWKEEFKIYLKLSGGYNDFTEEQKALLLMNLMGTEAFRAVDQMTFENDDQKNDMDQLIMKFDEFYDPPLNEAEERYTFFSTTKGQQENVESYVEELKMKAEKCNFGSQKNKFIVDMVIRSMDNYLQIMIFKLEDPTLADIIQYYKQYIESDQKFKELSRDTARNFNSESTKKPSTSNDMMKQIPSKVCWKCDTNHAYGSCPAFGKICFVCKERNHFSGMCKKMADKVPGFQTKRCFKCGNNHPHMKCPAHDEVCGKCFIKGHYTHRCKFLNEKLSQKTSEDKTDPTLSANNQPLPSSSTIIKIENCLWCGSKHFKGQCKHDSECRRCDSFPHNICFECKKNPHDNNCYYKQIITLPTLSSPSSTTDSQRPICLHCAGNHESTLCRSPRVYCTRCLNFGHTSANCYMNPINPQQPTNDPLLRDYVRVQDNTQSSSQARFPQQPKQTPQKQFQNNNQFKNNNSKKNEKPDACVIS